MIPKHCFFDLDGTLTRSKSHIEPEHAGILGRLADRADIVVVSGHDEGSVRKHLGSDLAGRYFMLSQNGNHAEDKAGRVVWERKLTPPQVAAIYAFIERVRARFPLDVVEPDDLVEDRGCEVAFSLIGHHEKIEKKEAFDPGGVRRQRILGSMQDDVAALARQNIEVCIGGTTVLDFIEKGKNKGYNVSALIEIMAWNKSDCLYIGDALFPGGNDETVIGVIPTHAVKNHNETFDFIAKNLLSS